MKITKSQFTFEGTPEELKDAYPLLVAEMKEKHNESTLHQDTEKSAEPAAMTLTASPPRPNGLPDDAVRRFMTRRPLTSSQKAVLNCVYEAGEAGTTSSEIASRLGCAPGSVKATMRSFGKRVAHTEGWPSGVGVFKQKWEGTQNRYRLHPQVRAYMET